ncbi:conserved hypothetical protein [Streptomyces sp. SPB78]|nr:hypothetical protein SSBG_03131 [Streptomyces sp. SPB074]EFL01439.1 conserved hypothetical protein [Streptomyces sp. SPB78]
MKRETFRSFGTCPSSVYAQTTASVRSSYGKEGTRHTRRS